MFIYLGKVLNDASLGVVCSEDTEVRLRGTCFRGKRVAFAGNFFQWSSVEECLRDGIFRSLLRECATESLQDFDGHTPIVESATIEYPTLVGWEGTDDVHRYTRQDLEPYAPNRRSHALRVKLDANLVAPLTSKITIVGEYRQDRRRSRDYVFFLRSMYPGEDIGELIRNVTKRMGRVFFDWTNPGEPLVD